VFFPMHFMGLDGVPRRYYAFTEFESMSRWLSVNTFITWAAIIAALGQAAFLFNFFYSIFFGKRTTQNPWNSNTLEWTAPVEHIHGNWIGEIPTVYRWPYDYSKPGHDEDFIPQTVPFSQTMSSNLPHDFEDNPIGLEEHNKWTSTQKANEEVK
ncbi:MAG: cytochrome c oxidase subunit I, partial [Sphingobacteriaceae bacterium]